MALVFLAGGAVGVAVLLGGLTLAERELRDKLAAMAERAGITVHVGFIVLDLDRPVALRDVELRDPADDAVLLRCAEVRTNLTFRAVLAGARWPERVTLVGADVDARDLERWKAARERYRSRRREGDGPKRALPELVVLGGSVRGQVPALGPLPATQRSLSALRARVVPSSDEQARWQVVVEGQLDGHTMAASAMLDPERGDHEAALTISPRFEVALPDGTQLAVGAAYARAGHGARVRGVSVRHGDATVELETVELVPAAGATSRASAWTVRATGLAVSQGGRNAHAGEVVVDIGPAVPGQSDWHRLRQLMVAQADVEVPDLLLAGAVRRVEARLEAFDPKAPLAGLREVTLEAADLSAVLPSAERAASIPYYRQIQAFLVGSTPELPAGGGPANVAPPNPAAALLGQVGNVRPKVRLIDGSLSLLPEAASEPAAVLDGVEATLDPGATTEGVLAFAVSGRLRHPATGEHGSFSLSGRTRDDGKLERAHVKLSGTKLAQYLTHVSELIRLSKDTRLDIDLDLVPHARGKGFTATGSVGLRDVGFQWKRIHHGPVDGINVMAELTVDLDPEAQKLTIDLPSVRLNDKGVLRVAGVLERWRGKKPKFELHLRLPRQDCGAMLESIPPALVSRLDGLALTGTAEGYLDASIDLENPKSLELDVDVDLRKCRPKTYGSVDVERLNGSFVQEVVEKGEPIGVFVGPATREWQPMRKIPEHVQLGAIFTEDRGFYEHRGFRVGLIRRAIIIDIEGERYVYGGSTITQQLVKNLFLSREKTLARKLEEAIIVWLVERVVPKKRILELYLNCIEYGPKLYGIQNAAKAYFDKDARELLPLEGAFLMGLKPYPWAGWRQRDLGHIQPWWYKRLSRILEGMAHYGWITPAELEQAKPYDVKFVTSPGGPARAVPATEETPEEAPPPTVNERELEP